MATKKGVLKMVIGKKTMVHKVRASLVVQQLSKAGSSLQLDIFNAEGKLGSLVIGQGSLTWYAKSKQTGKNRSWTAFADWMDTK